MKPPLVLRELVFRWPQSAHALFSGVSLEFFPGTVSTLMGANGTGKTTLLEVVSGRLSPESGDVRLNNSPHLDDFNYLPQNSARLLFSHLTLSDNIALQRTNHRSLPSLVDKLFKDPSTLSRYPAQCSGGQRQRAAVCRAILDMPHFPVTLLDESFSQLSSDAKGLLGSALKDTAKTSGAIVLLVTHDLFDAMRFGDRVLTLAGGQVTAFDTTDISSEDDCWSLVARREEILRSVFLTEAQPI